MRIVQEALTFDDVLLVPAYSEVLPREVDLSTQLTRGIRLNLPFVSAAMDTVTEARLAITIAQEGGIGIIHKNMPPADQAREVGRVKKHESGVIKDPITVRPDATIREVVALTRAKGISGLPVTADGNQVVGIITHRDIRFEEQLDLPVSKVMTPRSLPEIGRRFGGRDHTTVLHAVRKIEDLSGSDNMLAQELELLRRLISDQA